MIVAAAVVVALAALVIALALRRGSVVTAAAMVWLIGFVYGACLVAAGTPR